MFTGSESLTPKALGKPVGQRSPFCGVTHR
nr:MAG TPA: hypothetical protein [Caudoviricetes sp.]